MNTKRIEFERKLVEIKEKNDVVRKQKTDGYSRREKSRQRTRKPSEPARQRSKTTREDPQQALRGEASEEG
jgi:hypothetical protein